MNESERQWWYAGLRAVGERPLTEDELHDLRELVGERMRKIGVGVGVLAASLGALVGLLYAPFFQFAALPALYFLGQLVWRRQALTGNIRQLLAARRDVRAGTVVQCAGAIRDLLVTRSRLLGEPASNTFMRDGEAPIAIEVLPQSQTLWTCDGRRPYNHLVVPKSSTAPAPEHARLAANFVQPIRDGLSAHQRALSPDEVAELEGYAPAVDPARFILAALLVLASVTTFWLALQRRTDSLLLFGIFTGLAIWTTVRLVRNLRWRRRIAADVREARVLIIRADDKDGPGKPHEFLMHSRIAWTVDGVPAAWRRLVR